MFDPCGKRFENVPRIQSLVAINRKKTKTPKSCRRLDEELAKLRLDLIVKVMEFLVFHGWQQLPVLAIFGPIWPWMAPSVAYRGTLKSLRISFLPAR